MSLVDRIRTELLTCGMEILNSKLMNVSDEKLLVRMAEMWAFFFGSVLPYLQGIFLPIQMELTYGDSNVNIRNISLQSFRDLILFPQMEKLSGRMIQNFKLSKFF